MVSRVLLATLVAVAVVACSSEVPASSPTVSPSGSVPSGGLPSSSPAAPAGAVAHLLEQAGLDALEKAAAFDPAPLSTEVKLVCVGDEPVRVYVYPTPDHAAAAARTINPRNPSEIGTSMITWNGQPKFWLHDRSIVLYLGTEPEITGALLAALGEPFAAGQGRALLPEDACA